MRNKVGTLCMVLGALMILSALALFGWNSWDAERAQRASQAVLPELMDAIEKPDDLPNPYDTEMTVVEIDGNGYIGYLSIPSLELELPVMSEWSYDGLKIAPCRFSGSVKSDDLVIAGHNYAGHFSNLRFLEEGAEIVFTDMDGRRWKYCVSSVETLRPEDVDNMTIPSTDDPWDLTLFTCTPGGASRCAVRGIRSDS